MTDEALGELFDAAREKQDRRVAMFSYRPWCDLPPQAKANVRIFAESIAALAASRVDTAEVERWAARKACNAMRDWFIGLRSVGAAQTFSEHRDRYLAREYPAPAPRECRKHEGDFFGVPLYSDPNCPTDRVVFEYDGKAVACALIHPDSTALRRNAADVGQ